MPVWLPCFTLYEFTCALRFAIGREARSTPLYLTSSAGSTCNMAVIPAAILHSIDKYLTVCLACEFIMDYESKNNKDNCHRKTHLYESRDDKNVERDVSSIFSMTECNSFRLNVNN